MGQEIKMICVDWDGTFGKTLPQIHKSFTAFCVTRDIVPPTIEEMLTRKEHHWHDQLRNRGYRGTPEEAIAFFREYDNTHPYERELYPDVKAGLEVLAFQNIPVCLITLNEKEFVEPHLRALGIHSLFSDFKFGCPDKAAALRDVCRERGIPPENCAFIGDALSDIRHSRNAGVISVAFLNGHIANPEEHFVDDAKPHYMVGSFSEFITLLLPKSAQLLYDARHYGKEFVFPPTG